MIRLVSKLTAPGNVFCHQNPQHVLQQFKACSTETRTMTKNVFAEPEDDKLYKRVEIELRSSDPAVMKSYTIFATTAAKHLGIEVGKVWIPSPRAYEVDRHTLLRSAFVHKKHRVQYEIRTYFQFMHFHRLTGSTLSTFLEYIERNLPEGVALKATKIEILQIPEHIQKPPPTTNASNEPTQNV